MKRPMYLIGIDAASETFTTTVSVKPAEALHGPKVFTNNLEGFEELVKWFKKHDIHPTQAIICMEATGVYGEKLCYFLNAKNYSIAVEPPLKVKRAFDQSGHKTDAVDSLQIAEYAYRFFDELNLWKPRKHIVEQIQVLLSTREHFVSQKTASINTLKTLKAKYIQTPVANKALEQTIDKLTKNIQTIEQEIEKLIKKDPTLHHTINLIASAPGFGLLMGSHLLVLSNGFTKTFSAKQLASYLRICPFQYESGKSVFKKARSKEAV